MTHVGMAGNGVGWASGQGGQAGRVGRRERSAGRVGGHGEKRGWVGRVGQGSRAWLVRSGDARVRPVLLGVSGCPPCLPVFLSSCLSAPLGAPRLPRQADTHTLAHARDPRGGRVPLRTLHISERELL